MRYLPPLAFLQHHTSPSLGNVCLPYLTVGSIGRTFHCARLRRRLRYSFNEIRFSRRRQGLLLSLVPRVKVVTTVCRSRGLIALAELSEGPERGARARARWDGMGCVCPEVFLSSLRGRNVCAENHRQFLIMLLFFPSPFFSLLFLLPLVPWIHPSRSMNCTPDPSSQPC